MGCSTAPTTITNRLPIELTRSCGEVELQGTTWGDLLIGYKEAKGIIEACNLRLEAIREHELGLDKETN
jgi:hypothetical protein